MKQEEYFGTGSIKELRSILKKLSAKKIFLITGKKSFKSSGAKDKIEVLTSDYDVSIFSEFEKNPRIEDIRTGLEKFKQSGSEVVVAIGGGSVLDTAKSINIISKNPGNIEEIVKGKVKISNSGNPLVAIPTTAGSGSEATHFAVVYIDKEKYSIADEKMLPDYSLVDPELTYSLDAYTTATSGMDAFAQAVESYWSVNSNEESKKFSKESIGLILENLPSAVNNPDEKSRNNMMKAANLSGKAINITKTTAPHAVSYSLTSYFGVTHGQAVSVTLGEFLDYNSKVTEEDIQGSKSIEDLKSASEELVTMLGCSNVKDAKERIRKLMKDIGLKTTLAELNIKKQDLSIIKENVNLERLQNNPRQLSKQGLEVILSNILN